MQHRRRSFHARKEYFSLIFVPVELKRGYVTVPHPLLVHGSFETRSERSWRAVVLNAFADGTYSDTDHSLLEGVPAFAQGAKLEGQFFPLLFDGVSDHK